MEFPTITSIGLELQENPLTLASWNASTFP